MKIHNRFCFILRSIPIANYNTNVQDACRKQLRSLNSRWIVFTAAQLMKVGMNKVSKIIKFTTICTSNLNTLTDMSQTIPLLHSVSSWPVSHDPFTPTSPKRIIPRLHDDAA